MNEKNGRDVKDVIVAKILNGEPLHLTAFDNDRHETASNKIRLTALGFGRGHVRTVIQPHPTMHGCIITLHLGALPAQRRKEMADALQSSPLSFEIVNTG